MMTYTILSANGSILKQGVSLHAAAQMIMTSGGREWEIRKHSDGGFTAWQRERGGNQSWNLLPPLWSTAPTRSAADREIFEKIVNSTMFSDQYAAVPEKVPAQAACTK